MNLLQSGILEPEIPPSIGKDLLIHPSVVRLRFAGPQLDLVELNLYYSIILVHQSVSKDRQAATSCSNLLRFDCSVYSSTKHLRLILGLLLFVVMTVVDCCWSSLLFIIFDFDYFFFLRMLVPYYFPTYLKLYLKINNII